MQDASPSEDENNTSAFGIYRHTKRTEWGLGSMVWERDGKRAFKFEDGEERIIAEPFYHLLEKVADADPPSVEGESAKRIRATLDDQIVLFLDLFPGGFDGEEWTSTHRGGSGRRLKRHREPAIAEAKEKLAPEILDDLIAKGEYDELRDRICDVLGATDLATKKHIDQMRSVPMNQALARALRDFLHRDGAEAERFNNVRRELGDAGLKSPSWNLLTGILTLVQPQTHICIRPSVLDQQAKLMRPAFTSRSRPSWAEYSRYLDIVNELRNALEDKGQPPADMLDVYDFIWVTLRPAEKDKLESIAAARPAREAAAAVAEAEAEAEAEGSSDQGSSDSGNGKGNDDSSSQAN